MEWKERYNGGALIVHQYKMNVNLTVAVPKSPPAAEIQNISHFGIVSGVLFLVGTLLNSIAYSSIDPVFVSLFFLLLGHAVLLIPKAGGKYERLAYQLVFSIGWFWSGLTAIFENFVSHQGFSDAVYFFDLVTNKEFYGLSLVDAFTELGESGGAVILWLEAYKLFSLLAFEQGRYIGVAVNVTCVAFTAVVGLKMVKTIFGDDGARFRRFILIFAFCGNFWLLAAIHIRDAVVLFAVSLLTLFWVRVLALPNLANISALGLATAFAVYSFGSLRDELVYVPLAMIAAGLGAIICEHKTRNYLTRLVLVVLFCGSIGSYLLLAMQDDLSSSVLSNQEGYNELSFAESQDTSLGTKLVLNQSPLLRLLFGSTYLFIYPIPFWSGFQQESSYHIFKSLNVLFMYAVTPLFALAVWRVIQLNNLRRASVLFLLFVVIGFTLSVAYTSDETRHFAAFLVPLMVFALIPDLSRSQEKTAYRRLFILYIVLIGSGHLTWILLKGSGAS